MSENIENLAFINWQTEQRYRDELQPHEQLVVAYFQVGTRFPCGWLEERCDEDEGLYFLTHFLVKEYGFKLRVKQHFSIVEALEEARGYLWAKHGVQSNF